MRPLTTNRIRDLVLLAAVGGASFVACGDDDSDAGPTATLSARRTARPLPALSA